MTETLTAEQLSSLTLSMARLLAKNGHVDDGAIDLLLMASGMEGADAHEKLTRIGSILARAVVADESLRTAVTEALTLLGLPEGPAAEAVRVVAGSGPARASTEAPESGASTSMARTRAHESLLAQEVKDPGELVVAVEGNDTHRTLAGGADALVVGPDIHGSSEDWAQESVAPLRKDSAAEAAAQPAPVAADAAAEVSIGRLWALCIGRDGTVYTADIQRDVIYCLAPDLTLTRTLGPDFGEGIRLTSPQSLAAGRSGSLYVICQKQFQQTLYRIDHDGKLIQPVESPQLRSISSPVAELCAHDDFMYVLEVSDIVRFRDSGTPTTLWGRFGRKKGDDTFQRIGAWDEELPFHTSFRTITAGPDGRLYVAVNYGLESIFVLSPDGTVIDRPSPIPNADDRYLISLAVNGEGHIFATLSRSDYVTRADLARNRVETIGGPGEGLGLFREPGKLALDVDENLYVVDAGNRRIQKFDRDGSLIAIWPQPAVSKA